MYFANLYACGITYSSPYFINSSAEAVSGEVRSSSTNYYGTLFDSSDSLYQKVGFPFVVESETADVRFSLSHQSSGTVTKGSSDCTGYTYFQILDGLTQAGVTGSGGSPWLVAGSDISYQSGNVGIGTAAPTSELDVNGKLRSNLIYGTSQIGGAVVSTSSTTSTFVSGVTGSVQAQANDIISVNLACNLITSPSGIVYMRVLNSSGVGSWIRTPNWITVSGTSWSGGSSIGLFQAGADGTVVFQPSWHVSSSAITGSAIYCNLIAYVVGKASS